MTITRGHKIKERFSRDVLGKIFFAQRVVGAWNVLPREVVEADTLATFKIYLDRHMYRWGQAVGLGDMIGAGLLSQRACSCAVLFFEKLARQDKGNIKAFHPM